jgi:hypothetical protein
MNASSAMPTNGGALPGKGKTAGTIRGIALISTLAIVAIVTILLVSFVSVVNQDRGATQNYGQAIRADQIARGGLDTLVALLRQEATSPSFNDATNTANGGTNTMYSSAVASNMFPQKWGGGSAFPTIVSYSGTNVYATNGGGVYLPTPDKAYTTNASLNGRAVGTNRWNQARLTSTVQGFPVPSWVLVTRGGARVPASLAAASANGITNNDYVIGRYAYVLYDLSGLIDINVAGSPSPSGTPVPKGLLPWADLTQLTNSIQAQDVTNLVAWRNAATGDSATNFAAYVTNCWATNGFRSVTNRDNAFLSRQDLIQYLTSQNSSLADALPFLTTFSREVNGPTWGPASNAPSAAYAYYNTRTNALATNALAYQATVTAGGWTREYYPALAAQAGEPAAKYRFPLNRLSILENQNAGNLALSSGDADRVAKYFGLDAAPDSKGLYRHWLYPTAQYPHSPASSPHIYTLAEVAAQNREPDFFELLKAGILSGSLGMTGRGDGLGPAGLAFLKTAGLGSPVTDPDASVDGQIIQIGANIIDQWDADDYPTTITYPFVTGTDYYGVEDLPYISQIYVTHNATATTDPQISPPSAYLYFKLWNPHQPPATANPHMPPMLRIAALAGPPTASVGMYSNPANPGNSQGSYNFCYGMSTNNTWTIYQQGNWSWTSVNANNSPGDSYIQLPVKDLPAGDPDAFRINSSIALSTLLAGGSIYGKVVLYPALGNIPAYQFPVPVFRNLAIDAANGTAYSATLQTNVNATFGTPATSWATNGAPPSGWKLYFSPASISFAAMFQDPNTPSLYHPYGIFSGSVSNGLAKWGLTVPQPGISQSPQAPPWLELTNAATVDANYSFVKSDPRTSRWGASWSMGNPSGPSASTWEQPTNSTGAFGAINTLGYDLTKFSFNTNGGASTDPGYLDPDGVRRPGDNAFGGTFSSATAPVANDGRPVMLNRHFTSVAEMGFAFRDMPWRTLDFSSSSSADAGLLDLFTIEESPVVAGRVNPNTPYPQVTAALLAGAPLVQNSTTVLSGSDALQVADEFCAATTTNAPLITRADIVSRLMTNSVLTTTIGTGAKAQREAIARALAESANTRTWNLLIDVVAQSGKYPTTATTFDNFVVTGERRYWLHVAIDRYTGQVVDSQLERVGE